MQQLQKQFLHVNWRLSCFMFSKCVLFFLRVLVLTQKLYLVLLWFTDQQSTPTPTSSAGTKDGISPSAGKQTSLPTSLRTSLSSIRLPASTPMPSTRKPTVSATPVVPSIATKGNTRMATGCVCVDEETLTHCIHDSFMHTFQCLAVQFKIVPNAICCYCNVTILWYVQKTGKLTLLHGITFE